MGLPWEIQGGGVTKDEGIVEDGRDCGRDEVFCKKVFIEILGIMEKGSWADR